MDTDRLPKLTMMDEYARRAMLSYPSIYPNRLRLLCHLFLTIGNGIEWEDDGTITCEHYDTEMDILSLDERKAKHVKEALDRGQRSGRAQTQEDIEEFYEAAFAAGDKEAYEDEIWVSEHILELVQARIPDNFKFVYSDVRGGDLRAMRKEYNSHTMTSRGHGGHYEEAKNLLHSIKSGYTLLARIPERVEKSFFEAGLEILDAVIRSTDDIDQRSELEDYRDLLVHSKTTYDGGLVEPEAAPKVPPIVKTITLREDGIFVSLRVNGKVFRRFKEYTKAAEVTQRTFNLPDARMLQIYRSYRKDRERQERENY